MTKFNLQKWLEDAPIKLVEGEGSPETGGCWMSALSKYAGDRWSDHPPCVDFASGLGTLCIRLNDLLPTDEARGRVIGPHILEPVGTATDDKDVIEERKWVLIDAGVRKFAPHALRVRGLVEQAERLEKLPKVSRQNAAYAARAAADVHAYAAYAAADVHAYAAYAAAGIHAYAVSAAASAADHADAVSAAYSAAYANASYAYAAADHAAYAAVTTLREEFGRDVVMPVILEMCRIGHRAPVEAQCSVQEFKPIVQCV